MREIESKRMNCCQFVLKRTKILDREYSIWMKEREFLEYLRFIKEKLLEQTHLVRCSLLS